MYRKCPLIRAAISLALVLALGCRAQEPAYLREGDSLSHYIGVATQIENPNLQEPPFNEANNDMRPFSLSGPKPTSIWDLSLEETIRIAMQNAKVIRSIGGQVQGPPISLTQNPQGVATIYDPAITETDARFGVDAGLSLFDAQVQTTAFWERNREPRNISSTFASSVPTFLDQDTFNFQSQISKTNATGATVTVTGQTVYDKEPNNPENLYAASWSTSLQLEVRQPLLQGAGVEYNRIAGPGAIPGFNQGVVLARLNTDIALAAFEGSVRNLVNDVEVNYWELYFAYRNLDSSITFRNRSLAIWQKVYAKFQAGTEGGGTGNEAQAREQYFLAKTAAEQNLNTLYQVESKLRYMMGLASTDGRLIRPKDEPTTAKINFDWTQCHTEALCRVTELRQARFRVKQREMELIAARNYLLPRVDAVLRYKYLGLGPSLVDEQNDIGAIENTFSGEYQDWHIGFEGQVTLGYRKQLAGVRNAEEQIARERARLQETELEVSHQVAYTLRDVESNLVLTEENYNHHVAAERSVEALSATTFIAGGTPIDVLLSAERTANEAETSYYRALVDYTKSISQVHYRKGSLLEYNGVYLAEGPWPGKAYFDAQRRAKARAAATYFDYALSYPKVVSRGEQKQFQGDAHDAASSTNSPPTATPEHKQDDLAPASGDEPNHSQPGNQPTPLQPKSSDRITNGLLLPGGMATSYQQSNFNANAAVQDLPPPETPGASSGR